MMNTAKLLSVIVLLNIIIIFISFSYGADRFINNSDQDISVKRAVEKVLHHYLECRTNGDYKCCSELLTASYLQSFSIKNKMPYVDFYKNTETHYNEAKLASFSMVNDSLIDVIVESYSEEPGVLSKDIEAYRLKNLNGFWWIDDFSLNESKTVKEIGADGKWKDVRHD